MFEEQITESIEAGAPDITYSGNEGPKSPQQEQQQMMMQEQEQMQMAGGENDRVRELLYKQETQGLSEIEKIELRELIKTISAGMQSQDPRQMAAYGGIMGLDGRRQYGIGSSLKKRFRKLIPNEVAKVAEVAAPFIAPFNPLAAGLMSGIGGFDRTGSIGSSLKSGLMNYGGGQAARYLGGAGVQTGFNPMTGSGTPGGGFFSKPTGSGGIKNLFNKSKAPVGPTTSTDYNLGVGDVLSDNQGIIKGSESISELGNITEKANLSLMENIKEKGLLKGVMQNIAEAGLDTKATLGILGLSSAAGAYTAATEVDDVVEMDRGGGMDISGIRTEVIEAFKDPTGEKLAAIRIKYPFLGAKDTKDMSEMAYGGRARRAEGGLMNLGGMEKDYRAEGGFVPIGKEEKADDVPARLSVNEFVFTADAVRNAGGGDIDQGAEVMERVMKNLEQGGQISEETQGMSGAQEMFNVSERLSEVV